MKDKSFETAMNKIALQAEALQQKEAKDAQRQRTSRSSGISANTPI